MNLPTEWDSSRVRRFCNCGAVALLLIVALATAASWRLYPLFIDTFYHMGVISGFAQAGGITPRAFWEMAPGGRVHIYPPALHVIGYFLTFAGLSPRVFVTLVSATCYGGCLLTTWLWLRRVSGPRGALFALILLCGPYAFFWTQATFNAVAGVMVLAPLALLALETEHFLACAAVTFVTITMHPIGLFLTPALVINALLRRKKLLAGLLAAAIPVLLYTPWLAHIWANRAFLPDSRTGGDVSLAGFGVGGVNLGVLLLGLTAVAIPALIIRRGPALGLVGALLGFAVVFPMGFGGRFFAFNIHWPLACLAGYGLAELGRCLEQRFRWRTAAQVLSIALATFALLVYPALEMPLPRSGGPPGGPGRASASAPGSERERSGLRSSLANLRLTIQPGALSKLFEVYGGAGTGMGMGGMPGPGPGAGPQFGGRQGLGRATRSGRNTGPAAPAGPDRTVGPGRQTGPVQIGPGAPGGPGARGGGMPGGPGGGGGPGGDLLTRAGADAFFAAVQAHVKLGDVIYMNDGPAASMLVGVTGRWTSGGILRDVRSETGRTGPQECDFFVVLSGGGGPGPGGFGGASSPPGGFEQVFENEYGTLYRNTAPVVHAREPLKPGVSLPLLVTMAAVGLLLTLIDFLPARHQRVRRVAAILGLLMAGACLAPLTQIAVAELCNPPQPPQQRWDGGPGAPGGPGFGGPNPDPKQALAEGLLRTADADRNGTATAEEFGTLATRWSETWDTDHTGTLTQEEIAQGVRSILGSVEADEPPPPPDMPMFGPVFFLAERVFAACDTNHDDAITPAELAAALGQWFRDWDTSSQGKLDAAAISRGLEAVLGPPPQFGDPQRGNLPPPGPPGGP